MKRKTGLFTVLLAGAPFIIAFFALCAGRYAISVRDVFRALIGLPADKTIASVVFNVRLPRILLALAAGGGLSLAGAASQAVFGNPLASPDITGVESGASFGAAIGLLFSFPMLGVQVLALLFGCTAIAMSFLMSRIRNNGNLLVIILAGIIVSSLFSALVSLVKYTADPFSKLPAITFWLMGSMTGASFDKLTYPFCAIAAGSVVIMLQRWRLNALALRDDEIRALGMYPARMRWQIIICASMIVSAVVSVCGQIGWVALVIPHIARSVFGWDNRKVIPASLAIGAGYMLAVDTIARSLTASEIPLSILTAIIGAPVFGFLYFRKENRVL
ncbi:MAG: iron ABC transporter permease [Treponema sp.]|jgi:iron complex transport system permease protein|nr:iron ABC transporter permease [Treponema sp.]